MSSIWMGDSADRRAEHNRELAELYCEFYDTMYKHRVKNLRLTALAMAICQGSPRYAVGFDRAYIVVNKLLIDKKAVKFKSKMRYKMWLEITKKTETIMLRCKMSVAKSLNIVLECSRASQFFLEEHHAWDIIKKELTKMNVRKPYGRAENPKKQ